MPRLVVTVIVAVLTCIGAGVVPSNAQGRISCRLVVDQPNDTTVGPPPATVPSDEPVLDITAGDVAVDRTSITTAVTVRHLDTTGVAGSPALARWSFLFSVGGTTYMFQARSGQGGVFGEVTTVTYADSSEDTWVETFTNARATVTLDSQRNQIRVTARRAALGVPAGARLTGLRMMTWHEHTAYNPAFKQPGGEYDVADSARSRLSYRAGTPSCVRPGS